jgi:hypothetical protein
MNQQDNQLAKYINQQDVINKEDAVNQQDTQL